VPDPDELHRIEQLAGALDDGGAIMAIASSVLAEDAIGLIKDGFRAEKDPYGKRWANKQKSDGRKVLSGPTSMLKGGWHVEEHSKRGFLVAPSVDYAAHHQNPQRRKRSSSRKRRKDGKRRKRADRAGFGGLTRPRRMMVPDEKRGMPKAWADEFAEAAEETMGQVIIGAFGKTPTARARNGSGSAGRARKGSGSAERAARKVQSQTQKYTNIIGVLKSKLIEQIKRKVGAGN
jgi:hypothetical protein